jgi:hypothetical protein
MELGAANQWRTQGVKKVRERCSSGNILQDVRDRRGLVEMKVLDLSHGCGEDVGSV